MKNLLVLGLITSLFAGCESTQWREIAATQKEIPAANVPLVLRQTNWPDAKGSGSCVIASSCSVWQWCNRPDLAEKFRKSYAGGQTDSSIKAKWKAARIAFVAPEKDAEYGDPEALQWASDTRRAAIIWYFPNHCVTFCGFSNYQGKEVAWLLDNNRTKQFIPIEKRQFISEWRSYGGFYAIPLLTPAPSLPFPGYEAESP
jgi:hypothetical protein